MFIVAMQATSADVVRQTANLHTAIMLVAAIALLPFSGWIATALRRLPPSRQPVAVVSFLGPDLLAMPENALTAVLQEARRSLAILMQSLRAARSFATATDKRRRPRAIAVNEQAVSEIRRAVNDRVAGHEVHAIAGIYFSRQVISFDNMARHCRMMAREQQQLCFVLKPAKLDRMEPFAHAKRPPRARRAGTTARTE